MMGVEGAFRVPFRGTHLESQVPTACGASSPFTGVQHDPSVAPIFSPNSQPEGLSHRDGIHTRSNLKWALEKTAKA